MEQLGLIHNKPLKQQQALRAHIVSQMLLTDTSLKTASFYGILLLCWVENPWVKASPDGVQGTQ